MAEQKGTAAADAAKGAAGASKTDGADSAASESKGAKAQAPARPLDEAPRRGGLYLNAQGQPVDANGEPVKGAEKDA